MAVIITFYLAWLWASKVSALVVNVPGQIQRPGSVPDAVPTLSNGASANGRANTSILSLTTTGAPDHGHNTSLSTFNVSAEPVFFCDEGFGRDLNLLMCSEAFTAIPWMIRAETRPVTFGPRDEGTFNVGLPRRWMSSDGICAIQPFLVPGRESSRVAPVDAYEVTSTLIRRCVGGNPPKGGQARDIGGDNNLLITVTEFDPYLWSDNVQCSGSTAGSDIVTSCNNLADRMKASEAPVTFGPQGLPHDYRTPYTIEADNQCYLKVTSHPNNLHAKRASWYQIWEGAILINSMCIRKGKKGTFKVFSHEMDTQWLEVEVGDLRTTNNLTQPLTSV